MALNRIQASLEDSMIADVAEHAAIYNSGSFDIAMAELVALGLHEMKILRKMAAAPAAPAPALDSPAPIPVSFNEIPASEITALEPAPAFSPL